MKNVMRTYSFTWPEGEIQEKILLESDSVDYSAYPEVVDTEDEENERALAQETADHEIW